MAKFGKKYQDAAKLVEAGKAYDLAEAIEVVKKTATAKFDESVDVEKIVETQMMIEAVRSAITRLNAEERDIIESQRQSDILHRFIT